MVVFLLSRRGRWLHHFILRLSCCVVVEARLNPGAGRQSGEMLMKNPKVLWHWGSAKPSAAEVRVLLLSAKDLETGQKRRVQPRLQSIRRGGAEHKHHAIFFFIFILIGEKKLLISEPQASAGRGARLLCLFSWLHGMFVVWIWWCKTALIEAGSLGAWLHNPKQTGSEMQNPAGGLQ